MMNRPHRRSIRGAVTRIFLATTVAGLIAAFGSPVASHAATGGPSGGSARDRDDAAQASGTVATVAGGVGGPALGTKLGVKPCGLASGAGSLYLSEGTVVRLVSLSDGTLTTTAGVGTAGFTPDGSQAVSAQLGNACGMATDHSGSPLIAESVNNRLRMVANFTGTFYGQAMTKGDIYTIAGDGTRGFSGDGGPATSAELSAPAGVTSDGNRDVVIADQGNSRIRLVAGKTGTFFGQAMTKGDIYTIAGDGTPGFSGDGGAATSAEMRGPTGLTVDLAGNIVIADTGNDRIRAVAGQTGTFYGQSMTAGDIYTIAGNGLLGLSGNGHLATGARLNDPRAVIVDPAGNVVVADTLNSQIRIIAERTGADFGKQLTAGDIYRLVGKSAGFAGDGGPAAKAQLFLPTGLAFDAVGNLAIADTGNDRVRLVASTVGRYYSQAMQAGHIYTVAGTGVFGFSGDGGAAIRAQLPWDFATQQDHAGDYLIADALTRIRFVPRTTGRFWGQRMTANHIYTIAGDGTAGFSGDGGPATKAELHSPGWAVTDRAGNLLISDTDNRRVRAVAVRDGKFYGRRMKAGHIYTIAGDGNQGFANGRLATAEGISGPTGLAEDEAGNALIADSFGDRVLILAEHNGTFYGQPMRAGHVYDIAGNGIAFFAGDGGPGRNASLDGPAGITVDHQGNVLIADESNSRIRVVAASTGTFYGVAMTAGDIYTIGGDGSALTSGDGIPAVSAGMTPSDVAVDAAGNVVLTDVLSNRVRVIAASTGTFYGQAMTAGDIYTVAGDGTAGYTGDGGPAVAAEFDRPGSVTVSASGALVIADRTRVRIVAG